MGLLDWTEKNPALTQGLLAAAFGSMSGRGSRLQALGQGGMTGLLGYSNAQSQAANAKKEEEVAKMRQMQMGMLERQLAQQDTDQSAMRDVMTPVSGPQAMAGGGGPTMANAEKVGTIPQFDPRSMLAKGASPQAVQQAIQLQQAMNPGPKLRDVSPGAVVIDERTGQTVFEAPQREPDQPSAVREYLFAQGQGYKGSFNDFVMSQKRAGAANVNVPINMGQKGFDNTLKLRGDFRSEPIYKAHQEMQSAYAQISQGLKQQSPAGDLAGATKLMKLLDPGSVVRESELGMAMAASGLLDRVENYASLIMSGQKLTPAQRADFQKLADALYAESVNSYNAKRNEYSDIAKRNQLTEVDVVGPEARASNLGGWSIKQVP
jgi:hypothetical protein